MILLNDKPAVKVFAKVITETKTKGGKPGAYYLDIDGDKEWIPKNACRVDKNEETAIISEWKYKQIFPNE